MEHLNYMHVVPDSHFWTDLSQLVTSIKFDNNWYATKAEREERIENADHMIVDMHEPLTREYVLIGLKNSLKNGYDLKFCHENLTEVPAAIHFKTLQEIIDYVEMHNDDDFNVNGFLNIILHTINNGYNLTNNIKMEKFEVYNRVDGELEYQDLKWVPRREANGTPDDEKPPAEWISYMQQHINDANKGVYNLDDEEAMAQIRKVVALGVRALMIHGCPERIIPEDLLNKE